MTEFALWALLAVVPAAYLVLWMRWTRPRLLVLALEASSLGYRRPPALLALYVALQALAPITAAWLICWQAGILLRDARRLARGRIAAWR